MRFHWLIPIPALFAVSTVFSEAAPPSPSASSEVTVYPASVTLDSRRAYRQLVVSGTINGQSRDLTTEAVFRTSDPKVATVKGGRVFPAHDGKATITVTFGGRTTTVPVVVRNSAKPDPVRFKFETIAVLTKQGCAGGSCHGSPHGKGGFSLSLYGYDPMIDRVSLTRDGFNRRINVIEPTESLMLKKPLLEVPHVGGKRFRKTDTGYQVLNQWIYEGASTALPAVECQKIVVYPNTARVLQGTNLKQQISVLAYFSDGSTRDVTGIATYETSNASVAAASTDGLVTGKNRGQAAISVRYLDKLQSVYFTVVRDVPGFAWKGVPENNAIDRLVNDKLKQLQYLPAETCSDSVFLRRVSLDLTGMLPTPERTRQFLKDTSPGKRSRLIDELLQTEEYARFWALKKADLMRVSPRKLTVEQAEGFSRWLVDTVRTNMPYDRFARELLTATGEAEKTPAASYFLAIPTPEERTEMTAQIFMGSRIECAKCHNHPFENWTMRDYYSIAAVWARTIAQDNQVVLARGGEVKHPTTGEVMAPWGGPRKAAEMTDRRASFASWLTKEDNPLFAHVEVNRLWTELMGRGIVDPVDDFRSSNPPANVALLDRLAAEFVKSGYDRKHILRLICNSQTYQRVSTTNRFNESEDALFTHAKVRLLTAEQLKDAIGLTTRTLPPASTIEAQQVALKKQIVDQTAKREPGYPSWLTEKSAAVAALPFWQGGWHIAGPFPTGAAVPFDPTKQAIDLSAPLTGNIRWESRPYLRDGTSQSVTKVANRSYFLHRRLVATAPRTVDIQLKANDTAQVWLNGQLITTDPVRGERRLNLSLKAGANDLVLYVAGAGTGTSFNYRILGPQSENRNNRRKTDEVLPGLPPHIADCLAVSAEKRTPEQNRLLHEHFLVTDETLQGLNTQLSELTSRTAYATQRPYPEASTFTVTFGQPRRETACTCERQQSPTLLQALELLNGKVAYQMAEEGASRYANLSDDRLIEELYLSALCRFPTEKERQIARQYLTKESSRLNRKAAVTDLLLTVVNTQEFLFQH
jgi:hypothetical protein